jgi:anti-sigma28 factor (negative regulator of flagellin synthesis)
MFSAYLSINIVRIFSLGKERKSWELLDINESASSVFQKGATEFRKASPDPSYAQMGVRMERIVTIRAAIAQGSYHVSAAALARKLMGHMLAHRPSQN